MIFFRDDWVYGVNDFQPRSFLYERELDTSYRRYLDDQSQCDNNCYNNCAHNIQYLLFLIVRCLMNDKVQDDCEKQILDIKCEFC